MSKRWVHLYDSDCEATAQHLAAELRVSPIVARLLVQRDIKTPAEAERFFCPSRSQLHDPFLMRQMERAVQRLEYAIFRKERILVYGDYDVDGTTAVSLVHCFLRDIGVTTECYIPDRYEEGSGISTKGVRHAKQNGFGLVIALDCGIKAVEQMAMAKRLGVDFIICDHHLPGEQLPEAYALLDPKIPGAVYPYKELSGCGLGYKLLQAYSKRNGIDSEVLDRYLDLVAVSIIADLVEMRDENRVLTALGLERLNSNPSPGLSALCQSIGLHGRQITTQDVIFKISPRINAAGRMVTGMHAVRLLTARSVKDAERMAEGIEANNRERQVVDRRVMHEAVALLATKAGNRHRRSIVLYDPSWHKGVVAIVAARLVDTYYKPTVVLTESNGVVSGSARSAGGFDLYAAISECADLLTNYGGHKFAAGMTMNPENVEAFITRFEEIVERKILQDHTKPTLKINAVIELRDLSDSTIEQLERFAPFGPGNRPPIFEVDGILPDCQAKYVGVTLEHIKFQAQQAGCRNRFSSVGFHHGAKLKIVRGGPFRMCFCVERNHYFSPARLQLNVKDLKSMRDEE